MKTPRILLIEDDAMFRDALSIFLRARFLGELVVLSNGQEALRLLEKETFDLILTDFSLPGADGIKILSLAKKKDPAQSVFVLSGCDDEDMMDQIEALGGDYCSKPFPLDWLQQLIETCLEKKGGLDYKKS